MKLYLLFRDKIFEAWSFELFSFQTDSAFKALVRFHRCWVPTCKSVVSFEYFVCIWVCAWNLEFLPKFPSLDTVISNGTSSFYHCYCKVVTWFFTTWFTWWNPWMWMCAILSKLDADKCRTKAEISLFRPTIEMHYIRRRFLLCVTTIAAIADEGISPLNERKKHKIITTQTIVFNRLLCAPIHLAQPKI